jgi:hypothetical protein
VPYMKTEICFVVAGDINSPLIHFCAALSIFSLLVVTYAATYTSTIRGMHCCILVATVVT